MKYKIEWWTEHAAGDLPGEYETEEYAKQAADDWLAEMGEGYEAEVVECEAEADDDEAEEMWIDPKRDGWVGHDGRP